jgi:hypothetical protein
MAAPVYIVDPLTGNKAVVSEFGQLTVAPVAYSTPVQETLTVIDTAFTMIEPVDGKLIIITDIILTANKAVGVNDATVTLYTSQVANDLVPFSDILELEMIRSSSLPLTGLNTKIEPGLFVNAKTNDNDVFVTIMFYRVPV